MELLTILDEDLHEIGTAPRGQVHAQGLLHQVVHCWVVSEQENGTWVYYQQRSFQKRDFPGLYDLAVGGHIDAGEKPADAILREMREEIGISAKSDELEFLGTIREDTHIGDFFDRELGYIYLYRNPGPQFAVGEEVERMIRVPLEELRHKEPGGPESIQCYTLGGKPFLAGADCWCRHPGEFQTMLLPVLEKRLDRTPFVG